VEAGQGGIAENTLTASRDHIAHKAEAQVQQRCWFWQLFFDGFGRRQLCFDYDVLLDRSLGIVSGQCNE
jgi:hypothetical protein